ncbi:hypothetical protein GGI20_000528 [Coemansia sp. BCRC 34301]|nr:hypothetical protein GGI20_000528 [Coemansia sp. BCRC 34301]
MRWKTSDVYVEINVNRSSDNSDSESSDDGDVDVAGTSANSPVDVASHANTDSAGVVVDSNPLLVGSQARHSGIDESEEEDDFLNEGNRANSQPVAGPGSAADLTVLDFLSQRVIDEINTVVQVLDGSSSAASLPNSTFLRLDCYAHEQVLVRKNHFTRKPFISGDQRPIDEDDVVQWASSLQRINMATLLLLVVRPLIAVTEPVSSSMPNRERMVSSMGLGAAAQGFFGNVAPANLRNVETVDLLVELVTQKILAAANDERHLQTLVSDELGISNAGIARLLSIENYNDSGSAGQHDRTRFDVYSVPHYRKELGRRLNRVSGGRLHTARSLFSQQALWKKMVAFCAQCSASWRAPSILGEVSSRQVDGSFNAVDEDDELMDSAGDSGRGAVLDTKGQTAKDSDVEETESVAGGHLVNAAPIDPSFREERRVAALLRDVQADAHLEELLEAIDAEHIGISDQQVQSHTPRRVRPARRRVLAQVGNNSGNDSEFRLDAEEEHASVPGSADESEDSSSGEQTDVRRRLGKRRVIPEYSSESDLEEEQLAPDTRTPVKRSRLMPRARVEASRQAGSFRGRRGIAAEDPLDLIDDGSSRVALTPSPGNPPAFNVRRGSSRGRSSGQESLTTGLEALGQYRPLKLARSTATQTAANRRNRRDDRSDHSDYSDTRHVAAAQARAGREKPIQHRVRWSQAEEECLMQALSELGPQWTLILEYHGKEGSRSRILRHRTRFNIKDKARNIKRRLIRENRPLGPLAAVTG